MVPMAYVPATVRQRLPEKMKLPDGGDGFRNLLEAFEFGTLQEFRDVQKDDEPAFQFADTGDITRFAFGKNTAGSFYFRRRNLEHFGSGVDDQTNEFVLELDNEYAVLLVGLNVRLAKALAQVHHRNDFAAKVYDPLDELRRAGHGGDFRNADDLAHRSNTHAVRFVANPETHYLKVLFHQESPVPLGTRQFGVFGFLVAAFFRVTALAARFPAAEALLSGTVENKAVHAVAQIAREFQHLFGGSRQFGRAGSGLLNQLAHLIHGANDRLRTGSLLFNRRVDFLRDFGKPAGGLGDLRGGLRGFFRKFANFVGNHRETKTVFACAGGLDGGVQSQ